MVLEYLEDSKLVFSLSVVFALLLPGFADELDKLIVPILVVMMSFSIKDLDIHLDFSEAKEAFILMFLNFIVLGGVFAAIAFSLLEGGYRNSILVFAIMPPAVAVISLSYLVGGDVDVGFVAESGSYLFSIVYVPVMALVLFGDSVEVWRIVKTLLYIIVLPFFLSKLVSKCEEEGLVSDELASAVINVCLALIFYVIIGVNVDVIFSDVWFVLLLFFVFLVARLGLGLLMYYLFRKETEAFRVSSFLFSSFKNGGAAIAFSIVLFGVSATLPLAVNSLVSVPHIIFLEWFFNK